MLEIGDVVHWSKKTAEHFPWTLKIRGPFVVIGPESHRWPNCYPMAFRDSGLSLSHSLNSDGIWNEYYFTKDTFLTACYKALKLHENA